jgi:serine/threonine protein kinase
MELMDDSLTHYLESSPRPIPYHIQVNICHDITLALSFLHSNGIVHRDLSSNNVLLIGNVRAKVTDFGMARLGDQNPRATQLTFTMCPGTDAYMPPEAVQEEPVYTEKIDCFSFGVITLQILSRHFPKPGNRKKRVPISLPGLPGNTMVEVPIPETERRQNHISEIDPNHTLLQVALDCLKDEDIERPSAQQLCDRVAALKEDSQYSESMRAIEANSTAEQNGSDERDRELRSLRQQHSQQVRNLQQIIQSQTSRLTENDQTIALKDLALREKDETIVAGQQQLRQLEKEKNEVIEIKERELRQQSGEIRQLKRELEENERIITQFQRRVAELEQLRSAADTSFESSSSIKLTWRMGRRAPCKSDYQYCTAADDKTLYVKKNNRDIYVYTIGTSSWSQLPDCPTNYCPSVIINNLLTLVGGNTSYNVLKVDITNHLYSLTDEGRGRRWTEEFPPMPTKRYGSTAVVSGTTLVVAGGEIKQDSKLGTVEIMNIATKQWSTAAALPQPMCSAPAAVCGDQIYILGDSNMYTCSVISLIRSCKSFLATLRRRDTGDSVWTTSVAPPVTETTCVSIQNRLLAIGGKGSDEEPTAAVRIYNPTTDSWEVISPMWTPRWRCIAAVLPNNQLMVVGGYTGKGFKTETDSVELAAIE